MRFEDIDDQAGIVVEETASIIRRQCELCGAARPIGEFLIVNRLGEDDLVSECTQCRKQLLINKFQRERENSESGDPDESLAYFEDMDGMSFPDVSDLT